MKIDQNKKLIAILGPTASGKSNIAINLAKRFSGEIINVDSRSFYKNLDIGTAKPLKDKKISKKYQWIKKFQKRGPIVSKNTIHWLIDIAKIKDPMTVAIFKPMADEVIDNIFERKKIPFLVGGSGLYARAVLEGFNIPKVVPDYQLRKKLEKLSTKKLTKKLKNLSPLAYKAIDLNNRRRLIRAIEVAKNQKKPSKKSYLPAGRPKKKIRVPYDVLKLAIKIDKEKLNDRINKRVFEMIKFGWLKEVKTLIKKQYDKTQVFQNTIGYPQLQKVIRGKSTMKEAILNIQLKTRQFAKRQNTWFKKEKGVVWVKNQKQAERETEKFLKK